MRRILVLGGGGKVGRLLANVWGKIPPVGWNPVFQYRDSPPPGGIQWQPGAPDPDIGRVSAILALWGVTSPQAGDLSDNARLALAALDLARRWGVTRVLLCSSAAVYAPDQTQLSEAHGRLAPMSPYGHAKLDMENAVSDWARAHPSEPKACALRIANFVGADSLFGAMERSVTLTLDKFADGHGPQRSYITPGDFSKHINALIDCPLEELPKVVNISGARPLAMSKLAQAAGYNVEWRPAPASANQTVDLDNSIIRTIAGPDQSSSDAVSAVSDWQKWRSK